MENPPEDPSDCQARRTCADELVPVGTMDDAAAIPVRVEPRCQTDGRGAAPGTSIARDRRLGNTDALACGCEGVDHGGWATAPPVLLEARLIGWLVGKRTHRSEQENGAESGQKRISLEQVSGCQVRHLSQGNFFFEALAALVQQRKLRRRSIFDPFSVEFDTFHFFFNHNEVGQNQLLIHGLKI